MLINFHLDVGGNLDSKDPLYRKEDPGSIGAHYGALSSGVLFDEASEDTIDENTLFLGTPLGSAIPSSIPPTR